MIDWKRTYEEIMTSLKLDQLNDSAAPRIFSELIRACRKKPITGIEELTSILKNKWGKATRLIVTGPGPSLIKYRDILRKCSDCPIVAADSSVKSLMNIKGTYPDVIVTDLDGVNPVEVMMFVERGGVAVVHVHGDNYHIIKPVIHNFCSSNIMFTSQVETEAGFITRLEGFTDGDRSILLSLALEPEELIVLGMDFDLQPIPNSLSSGGADFMGFYKLSIGRSLARHYLCEARRRGVNVVMNSFFRVGCGQNGM